MAQALGKIEAHKLDTVLDISGYKFNMCRMCKHKAI